MLQPGEPRPTHFIISSKTRVLLVCRADADHRGKPLQTALGRRVLRDCGLRSLRCTLKHGWRVESVGIRTWGMGKYKGAEDGTDERLRMVLCELPADGGRLEQARPLSLL